MLLDLRRLDWSGDAYARNTDAIRLLTVTDAAAPSSSHGDLQIDGADVTTANTGTGWTVGTTASGNSSDLVYGTKRAAGTFSGTAKPPGTLTASNCWRTDAPMTGTFAATSWEFALSVMAVDASMSGAGRMRIRVWRGTDPTGAGATEITASTIVTTEASALSNGTSYPATLPNLALWLRADTGVTVDGSGLHWADQSGQGNHANAPSLARTPDYNATGGHAGGPSVDFNLAEGTALVIDDDATLKPAEFTLVIRYEITAANDFACPIAKFSDGSFTDGYGIYQHSGEVHNCRVGDGTGHDATPNGNAGNEWVVVTFRYDGSTLATWKNTSRNDDVAYSGTITHTTQALLLGAYGPGTATESLFDGRIEEVIFYGEAKSDAEVAALHAYLGL